MGEAVRCSGDSVEPFLGKALVSRRIDGTDPPRYKLVLVVPGIITSVREEEIVVPSEPQLPLAVKPDYERREEC